MIIWRGAGIVVVVVVLGVGVATQLATNAAFGNPTYYTDHGWPKLLTLWLAAAMLWPFGRWLNVTKAKEWIDPDTGERVVHHSGGEHSLFFIPVEYWAIICVIFGIVALFV